MYQQHFGLIDLPFSLQAEANYFVNVKGHTEALKTLLLGLSHADGFMKVTGEVGTGKTFLCNKLRKTLNSKYVTIYLSTPCVSEMDLFYNIARVLKLEKTVDLPRYALIERIAERLIGFQDLGKRLLFLVDEAQAMDETALEALRLLNYYQSERQGLFDIILFGQPELELKLAHPMLRSLAQRMVFSYQLRPLSFLGTQQYVAARLAIAGAKKTEQPFSWFSFLLLYQASQGVPRMINVLCHKAMLVAYREGHSTISWLAMREAILNTESYSCASPQPHWSAGFLWSFSLMVLGGMGLYLLALTSLRV